MGRWVKPSQLEWREKSLAHSQYGVTQCLVFWNICGNRGTCCCFSPVGGDAFSPGNQGTVLPSLCWVRHRMLYTATREGKDHSTKELNKFWRNVLDHPWPKAGNLQNTQKMLVLFKTFKDGSATLTGPRHLTSLFFRGTLLLQGWRPIFGSY